MEQKIKSVNNDIIFSFAQKNILFYSASYESTALKKTIWFEIVGSYITGLPASSSFSISIWKNKYKNSSSSIIQLNLLGKTYNEFY